jgi:hypothetical protein
MTSYDQNGACDLPEDIREDLAILDLPCGVLILSAMQQCRSSWLRIQRTQKKWKEATQ